MRAIRAAAVFLLPAFLVHAQGTVLPPEVSKLADASSGDTLLNAVGRLGLKVELRKAPIEMLVIDRALKTPTEN